MSLALAGRTALRRGLFTAFAGCVVGGAAVMVVSPAAVAAPDPCAASQIAKTVGSVATSTGVYLETHPETNDALTAIAAQPPGPQSLAATKAYFDANPEASRDMQRLQAPLTRLASQCELPVSVPQLLGVMQGLQTPAAGLPTAGLPTAESPVVSPVAQGTGPLPGPGTRSSPAGIVAGLP